MNMNRVLEVGRKWLVLTALALSLTGGARAQVGALADQPGSQEAEGSVEIEIRETSGTNDDLVPVLGSTPCRIRLQGAQIGMSVTLVSSKDNGNARLSFYAYGITNNGDGSLPLSLPSNGNWVGFSIGGLIPSQSTGDAVIEAHKDSASGTTKKTAAASVYWFKDPKMTVVAGSAYTISKTATQIALQNSGYAVDLTSGIKLMPSSSLSNAPQLSDLRLGIVQIVNSAATTADYLARFADPTTGAPTEKSKTLQYSLPYPAADVANGTPGPTYVVPTSLANETHNTTDTPLDQVERIVAVTEPTGTLYYKTDAMNFVGSFSDWCVLYNNSTGGVQSFTQYGWDLAVNDLSLNKVVPKATASTIIITTDSTQFANKLIKDAAVAQTAKFKLGQ